MKFFLSLVVYVLMAVLFGWGMLLSMKGQYWLLISSLVVYVVAFSKLGCLPSKSHH